MLHDNNTPLSALGFEQWHPNGATMAVVVARARIRVEADGSQFFVPDTGLVLADEFAGDPHKTPMLRCNDLIPFKPFADLTLQADLQSAEPRMSLEATVRLGQMQHSIRGCGPRHWFYDRGWRLSAAAQVTRVAVSYELASGGRIIGHPDGDVDPRNPIGAGVIHPDFTPRSLELRAAQIDSQAAPILSDPTQLLMPQGLGPVPPWWQSRQCFTGTYDADWLANTHPRLPQDFDYRHYQTAAPGLVLPHYLLPGMLLETEGLRPNGASFGFQIPDIMPFATFGFTDGRQVKARLHLDGLHLDLRHDIPTYDLTWRAWIEACPALHRIDLNMDRGAAVMAMGLPISGLNGLEDMQ